MRKRSKRLCSLLMALVMALSLLPTAVFAAEPAEQTYVKVTQKEELVTGKYVLVASNGYALGALDGTWITAVQPTVNEDKIVNPESGVWTLTVGKDGVQLTDAAGKTVAPSGSNNNGIKNAEYNWAVEFADGKFQFKGTGDDTVTLASNEKSGNKFRAYKNTTASGYPHEFTLYKLETAEQEKVATPTANVADGAEIEVGTKIEFSCTTEGAKLYYKTAGTEYQEYTGAIEATQIETYTVKATKDGMADSDELTVSVKVYQLVDKYVKADTIDTGDRVVIYNAKNGKIMTTEATVYNDKDQLKSAAATVADGVLSTEAENAAVLTVTKDENDKYSFATVDKYLYMDNTHVRLVDEKGENTLFQLETATDGWFIKADTANYNGKAQYMEFYADVFTVFGMNSSKADIYTFQFYKLTQEKNFIGGLVPPPTPDPDPEPEEPLFKDGEKVVIYNPANMKALSSEYSGHYNTGVDVTLTNGKLTGYTDAEVWTVGVNEDGSYTFSTAEGKKLSMGASYGSTPLDDVNTAWKITEAKTTGCYYIQNAVRGNYLEWYAEKGNWSSFSSIGDNELLFAQAFYRVQQSGIVTSLSDGDTVVVFNPANKKALSTEYDGYYNKGTDVTLADGKLSGYTKADIWTVGVNEDGSYTFSTAEGKKLSMGASYGSTPLDDVNTAWNVTAAKTENCFYIQNAVRGNYLEWFAEKGNWSSYNKISDEELFAQQFYLVVDDGASDQPFGDLPKAGDMVVLYNQSAKGVLAAQDANESPSILGVSAEVKDGKAIPANGGVVFTVEANGEYLRFRNETYGYLCSNGTGNNAFYSKEASEDADWTVTDCSGGVGGYQMESRTAKFNGKYSQFLEYFSESYKTYSMNKATDYTIYSFFFYPVAEGVSVTGGIVNAPAVDFGTILDAYVGMDYTLSFTVDAVFGVQDLTAKLGEEELTVTKNGDAYAVTIPVAMVTGNKLTVTVSGTDTKGVAFEGIAVITVKDEPVIANVTPVQGAETGESKRPAISAEIVNAGENASVTMVLNGKTVEAAFDGKKITYTPAADLADGKVTVTVTVERADGKKAEKTWSFTVGEAQYQLYFGQLHSHTQYSDGAGSLEDALAYVKALPAQDNVQFVAYTDHSNYFDKSGAANPEGALYDMSKATEYSQETWKSYKDAVAAFNAENAGSLVALAGFEMTWSGGPGHINTFNTPGIVSRNNTTLNNKTGDAGMKAYYALLSQAEGADSISQFNHPGTTFGTFQDFAYWDAVIDSRMYLVEVGNGEGQVGAGGYYPSYSEYIKALDKGWHLAPSNNQDNHKGRWGNANDARDVILTDDFSEEGIYAALRAMRVYATEDKNLEIGYTVNGEMLGSTISEVPEKLNFEISFYDPDKTDSISKVELVVNSGKVAQSWSGAELAKGSVSVTLDPDYSYYFVRVTEGDGDIAVTAPVWVGETLKLGISDVTCSAATPVTKEELTLTTTLFNSETSDAEIKSVTYTVGGEVIGEDTTAGTLEASSTKSVTFQYTPTAARMTTITVTVVLEQNGKEYTFTKDISLDVLDADKLVYIGIDASHYNEYVAGNYKDSMGNFGALAAEYDVRTVQLNSSEELIAACGNAKYKALILTAPSRRLAAAQTDPRTYSAEELAAIKTFNENGGTVILAGWSDNYENYDVIQKNPAIKHMAETQNDVLEALGSHLRISDDATYDDVRSAADGVDKWRLYFSDYNMENPLTDGVIYDAEHPYDKLYTERFSHYGGASIYAVDETGNAVSALPATVSPVVYGHATTYSVDVDSDGLGGAGTPKYTYAENDSRLMVMATEQLEGKGLIVVSGAAFMSNFEVQAQVDNGAEKNYSNYRICENLVSLFNQAEITPIAEVQAEKDEGVRFTIEGVVTSNASGYDKATAFFDCIYVQDATAGINAFPVAGEYKIGDVVRITGSTSSYQGERQIAVKKIVKIGETTPVAPKTVTAAQLADQGFLGSLVTVEGTATKIEYANGLIQTIMVRDSSGKEARIFIDGYITTDKDVANAEVGCRVKATGLASYDNTFVLADGTPVYQRIRIRDRADVVCTAGGGVTPVTPVTPTQPGLPFTDVSKGEWYYDGVNDLYRRGIMDGTTETLFAPSQGLSRGQLAMIFYRMAGEPEVTAKDTYSDVPAGLWCAKAVTWASANGLVLGYEDGTFRPDQPVQRQQLVAMLFRYAAFCGMSAVTLEENLLSFRDVGAVSGYARPAMNWAVGQGILLGSENYLMPREQATRAQVAMVLHRYLTLLG